MQLGKDDVRRNLRVMVQNPLNCSDGCVSIRAHLGLNETAYFVLNDKSALCGFALEDLRVGQVLIADVAGKQVLSAKPASKPFTVDGLICRVAFFKSIHPESGEITLQTNNLQSVFKVSADTFLLQPINRNTAMKKISEGDCSVNIWTEPNSDKIRAFSINFR